MNLRPVLFWDLAWDRDSMVLKMHQKKEETKFKLEWLKLEYKAKYKYLGITINNKSNMVDQIKEIKSKSKAAFQTILHLAGDRNFKQI